MAGLALVAVAIGLWQLLVASGMLAFQYLPAPSAVAVALAQALVSGELLRDLGHTLATAAAATGIAGVAGVLGGLLLGLVSSVRTYTSASIDVLRTVPVIALMPVALLIWGPSWRTEVIVASYAAVWPFLLNTAGGIASVPSRLHEVARVFQLSAPTAARKVVLPAAAPAILVGARLGTVIALVVGIVAEMFVDPQGLGWRIVQAMLALQPAKMWAYVIVVGALGYALNGALTFGVRRLVPGSGGEAL